MGPVAEEVSRRERLLQMDLRDVVNHVRGVPLASRRGISHKSPRQIEDELAVLTGVPARLSELALKALEVAALDGRVNVARKVSHNSGLSYETVNEGVPVATLHALQKRGLVDLIFSHGSVVGAQLSQEGARVAVFMAAADDRKKQRRSTMPGRT